MPRIQNVSPWGALSVPLLGRVVGPGEIVEVIPEHAEILLRQEANWADPDVALSEGIKAVETAALAGAEGLGELKDASEGAKKKGVAEK